VLPAESRRKLKVKGDAKLLHGVAESDDLLLKGVEVGA
jgi:hypothetical protein